MQCLHEHELVLRLENTDLCNLRCKMCWSHKWDHKELSLEKLQVLLSMYKSMGGSVVVFTSREPFMGTYFLKALRICKAQGLNTKVLSNLTLLSKDIAEEIISDDLVSFISTSIHGNKSAHDEIVGVKGSYEKTLMSLKILYDLKQRYNKKLPIIRITAVVSKPVLQFCDEIVDLADKYKTELRIQHYMWQPKQVKNDHKAFLYSSFGIVDSIIDGFSDKCEIKAKDVIDGIKRFQALCDLRSVDFQQYPDLASEDILRWYSEEKKVFSKAYCDHCGHSIRIRANGCISLCQYIDIPFGYFENTMETLRGRVEYKQLCNRLESGELFPICERCCHVRKDSDYDMNGTRNAFI